ncbi:glycosyltransferase [Prosthecobacter sp.]|uniref:glycosyltransferase n=1 Tax=Prosthecobacter sp. TaxID=1965333 RepID=UPI001D307EF5|nr:glycosyltransferase [Prosthecobacter sp.]MCB1275304.1 glycosyltransferase [Prosthecobacter sp.]
MKVAHVFIRMPVGGAEDLVGDILRTVPEGVDMRIVCLQELGKVGESLQQQFPDHVKLLPWVPGKRFRLGAVMKLARWLREEGIQVVHTHVYNAHVYGLLAARRAGIPAVLHHHKTYAEMRWRRKIILRALSHRAAAHLTLSAQTREDLCRVFGIPPERVRVFINPVDEDTFHPAANREQLRRSLDLSADTALVGTVASLTPPKNHLLNVSMTARLNELGFTGRFLAFGEGGERTRIAEAVSQQKLANFNLMGARRPIAPWMQSLDVFTLGSTWEGQPMVLLQALACELPIAASNIEGNAAVLGPDHPALFDVNDADAYANTVWRVLNDETFRATILAHQKRRKSELPMLRDYTKELVEFYQTILTSARH